MPCRKKENARKAPQFPAIYYVSLLTFSLCFHSLSHSCFNWLENCSKKCSQWLGKANTPKVLRASSITLCKLIFYTFSGENTLFVCSLTYLHASFMSLAIIIVFSTWSSHMKLPPVCLYILLSLNKFCILLLNAHFRISMNKQAKIWLSEHMCSFFFLLLRQMWLSTLGFVFWDCHMCWSHQELVRTKKCFVIRARTADHHCRHEPDCRICVALK